MQYQLCTVCGQPTDPVYVHGHYQCTVCGTNISPCCDGAQCDVAPKEADSNMNQQQ